MLSVFHLSSNRIIVVFLGLGDRIVYFVALSIEKFVGQVAAVLFNKDWLTDRPDSILPGRSCNAVLEIVYDHSSEFSSWHISDGMLSPSQPVWPSIILIAGECEAVEDDVSRIVSFFNPQRAQKEDACQVGQGRTFDVLPVARLYMDRS